VAAQDAGSGGHAGLVAVLPGKARVVVGYRPAAKNDADDAMDNLLGAAADQALPGIRSWDRGGQDPGRFSDLILVGLGVGPNGEALAKMA
jgi:hypothetical protein